MRTLAKKGVYDVFLRSFYAFYAFLSRFCRDYIVSFQLAVLYTLTTRTVISSFALFSVRLSAKFIILSA